MADGSIPVIVGPTAAGKSAIAMWIATRGLPLTVVSADSQQVYRGFDVGTAKPTRAEREQVPHAGIDVAEPTERYSAYQWAALASTAIEEARAAGRVPVVVGGTGLYIRTVFGDSFDSPILDAGRRQALADALAALSTEELRRWCERLDPARSGLGRVQLLRSIETALLAGRRLSDLHASHRRPARWRARYLVVDPGAALGPQIAARAQAMLGGAWQDEVRRLREAVPAEAPAWKASGYGAVRALVEGTATLDATRERVVIETRQYAKRQRTWFRHQLPADAVQLLDPAAPDWQEAVTRWWNAGDEARLS